MSESLIYAIYWYSVAILFGTVVGSFLNVVIARLPHDESVVSPRSRCPKCNTLIAWYDNVPILSWLILRAKCRNCKTPISAIYPGVELLTGVLSVLTFMRFVNDPARVSVEGLVTYVIYFLFVAALVAVTFIDFEHYIIPDEISLGGMGVGFILVVSLDLLGFGFVSWQSSLLGVFLGYGSLRFIMWVYFKIRGMNGMGMGDVKLMGMLGAFLGGHPALIFILFVSSFFGSIVGVGTMLVKGKDLQHPIPFGPFLAFAAILYLFWGYEIAETYLIKPFIALN